MEKSNITLRVAGSLLATIGVGLEVQKITAQGLDVVIVNPSLVYGAGDLYKQTSSLVVHVARRKVPFLVEGGINVIHIDDVITGLMAALDYGQRGERYILSGDNLTQADLIRLCAEVAGVNPPDFSMPGGLLRSLSGPLALLQPFVSAPVPLAMLRLSGFYFYYDHQKALEQLHWMPCFTVRQSLMEAYQWFKQQGTI